MILRRPNMNWNFLFLYLNMDIIDSKADVKNTANTYISSLAYMLTSSGVTYNSNTNINPEDTPAAIKRYMVCMRCNIKFKKSRYKNNGFFYKISLKN